MRWGTCADHTFPSEEFTVPCDQSSSSWNIYLGFRKPYGFIVLILRSSILTWKPTTQSTPERSFFLRNIRDHDIRPLGITSLTSEEGALNNLILLTNVGQCMFEQGKITHPLKYKI